MGLLKAMLDAIHGEDNRIAGRAFTRLTSPLSSTETAQMDVESTLGFGEWADGAGTGRVLINGEVIDFAARTSAPPYRFTTLTRGVLDSKVKEHRVGSLVYDLAENSSALDLVRRGFLVAFAIGEDLDVIGRNLGVEKCPGITEEQWRRIIQTIAYLPKQTVNAFEQALNALYNDPTMFAVVERIITNPWTVFVEIDATLQDNIRGRFYLNGGESRVTTGLTAVTTTQIINHVIGVYADTTAARRGLREGLTNYFSGGSFVGNTITLGSSPGGIGTPVLVDYGAFRGHYLALDETVRDDGDRWAYLTDPLRTARCLLDQVRAAGIKVDLRERIP